jgi:hypothetical protein
LRWPDRSTIVVAAPDHAENSAAGAGVVDVKNLLVGVGGMGNLPGLPALANGYGGALATTALASAA